MQLAIDLIALTLAVDATMTAWFYGNIFDKLFNMFNRWEESDHKVKQFFGEAYTCLKCAPYHCAFLFVLLFMLIPGLLGSWGWFVKLPMYSLAVTDLVHWFQGVRPVRIEEEDDTRRSEAIDSSAEEKVPHT